MRLKVWCPSVHTLACGVAGCVHWAQLLYLVGDRVFNCVGLSLAVITGKQTYIEKAQKPSIHVEWRHQSPKFNQVMHISN